MKQNKIKLGYQKPQTEIMSVNSESFLLDASFHSQHNPGRRRKDLLPLTQRKKLNGLKLVMRLCQTVVIHHCGKINQKRVLIK